MSEEMPEGCTPDACAGCSGCIGNSMEKIVIRVEWRHKGLTPEKPDEVESIINALSSELIVSGVELIYINNSFDKNIKDDSSEFMINHNPLSSLVTLSSSEPVTGDLLRKGIFQVLLCNK